MEFNSKQLNLELKQKQSFNFIRRRFDQDRLKLITPRHQIDNNFPEVLRVYDAGGYPDINIGNQYLPGRIIKWRKRK